MGSRLLQSILLVFIFSISRHSFSHCDKSSYRKIQSSGTINNVFIQLEKLKDIAVKEIQENPKLDSIAIQKELNEIERAVERIKSVKQIDLIRDRLLDIHAKLDTRGNPSELVIEEILASLDMLRKNFPTYKVPSIRKWLLPLGFLTVLANPSRADMPSIIEDVQTGFTARPLTQGMPSYPSLLGGESFNPHEGPSLRWSSILPLRRTLDVDLFKFPTEKSIVRAEGPFGTIAGKNFPMPEEVPGKNRAVAVKITSQTGIGQAEIQTNYGERALNFKKIAGDSELFLTWAGDPKTDAKDFIQPNEFHGLKNVNLTIRGGDRFALRHSGAPGTYEIKVYDAKDPETYSIGTVKTSASTVPFDYETHFENLKAGPNGKKADLTNAGAISIRHIQEKGFILVEQPKPCNAPCPLPPIQVALPEESNIHYFGVLGIDNPSGGGGFGPPYAGVFPPIYIPEMPPIVPPLRSFLEPPLTYIPPRRSNPPPREEPEPLPPDHCLGPHCTHVPPPEPNPVPAPGGLVLLATGAVPLWYLKKKLSK